VRGVELDPEPIEEALRAHRIYLARYPEGSHAAEAREGERAALGLLARKDCLNGETYLKAGRCAAARRYFGLSLARWAESPVSARALNGIARSHECENAPDSARAAYERLLAHLGEDAARYEKGEELARRAREKLARGATSGS
jgi:outer membrane protein assembly factor BamD (BamD/ComL family)